MRPAPLLLPLLLAAVPLPAFAQGMREVVPPGITVSGSATIKTMPDRATIAFDLRGEGATPDAASSDLARRQRDVAGGLARLDPKAQLYTGSVSTSEVRKGDCADAPGDSMRALNLGPDEGRGDDKGPCRITGYVAAISATMELSAVSDAGTAIGLAQRLGAASASLDGFSLRDPEAQQHAALAAAMADARTQAQALAAASGAHLGPIISVIGMPDGDMSLAMAPMYNSPPPAEYMVMPVKIDVSPKPVETVARVMVVYSLAN